jgi:diguanylate cyclase (GGDEF)-like protein
MDFHFDPTVSKHTSLVVTTFETAGTLLVALLLRLLTRGIPGRFLYYWSLGWVALAAGAVCLTLSFLVAPLLPDHFEPLLRRPAIAAYAVCQCGFGFFLWAGCRQFARGVSLRPADWWLFFAPAACGLVAPAFVTNTDLLFPFHTAVVGGFGLLALLSTTTFRPEARQTAIGLRMTQAALAGIALLFWHYTLVVGWVLNQRPRPDLEYLHYTALYDGLVEILLGFGMVVLGTDSVRRELEGTNRELAETNRRLAEASEELAVAARTDPLTGLLNRRGLEAMLAERAGQPFTGSIAVVDVNDLKKLNDTTGHTAGDAALQHVARALRGQFRITDPIFRLGGDEFLVILERGRAADLGGRLVALDLALRGLRLPGIATPVDVVVAWGMADFDTGAAFKDAFARADAEMYACKSKRKALAVG